MDNCNKAWLKTITNESKGLISLGSSSLGLQILKILITTKLFQTTTMVSRLENFKFLNYNNGLMSGVGVGAGWGGQVKLYTHLMNLRFVKNLINHRYVTFHIGEVILNN